MLQARRRNLPEVAGEIILLVHNLLLQNQKESKIKRGMDYYIPLLKFLKIQKSGKHTLYKTDKIGKIIN